jgi:hypothetical protein
MSDTTPIPKRDKVSPVKVIDTHEQVVRDYLNSMEKPHEPKPFNPIEVTRGIDDPIAKLKALSEAKRRSNVNELEEQFVDVAARWANKNDVGRESFAALGVPSSVLRRAFGSKSQDRQSGRTRISVDTLKSGISAKPKGARLTVAGITDEIGGSAATVRKVLDDLTKQGVIKNEGPDRDYAGRGRAPIVFKRV